MGTTFFPGTLKPATFPKCFPLRDMRNRWLANTKGLRAHPNWKPRCTTSGKEGPCPVQRSNLFKLCQRCRRSRSAWMCRSTIFYKSPPTTPRWRGRGASLNPRLLCPRRSSRSTPLLSTNSTPLISPRTRPFSGPASGTGLRPKLPRPCGAGWFRISSRASCRATFSRSSRTSSPSGNAIWTATIAGHTTTASKA